MSIILNDNIYINAGKPSEPKYLNSSLGGWANVAAVKAGIPISYRSEGLVVKVGGELYWFKNGVSDSDLVPYMPFLPATIGGSSVVSDAYQFKYQDVSGDLSQATFGNNINFQTSDASNNYGFIGVQSNVVTLLAGDESGENTSEFSVGISGINFKTTISGFVAKLNTSELVDNDVTYFLPQKSAVQTFAMISDIDAVYNEKISLDGSSPSTTQYISIGTGKGLINSANGSALTLGLTTILDGPEMQFNSQSRNYSYVGNGGSVGVLNFEALSGPAKTYSWPNKTDIIAMISDIDILFDENNAPWKLSITSDGILHTAMI